jgi:hypothetical protein
MLIPQSLAALWRGATNPATEIYSELNTDQPITDYDRACVVAWPGRSVVNFMGSSVLVLYTEFDWHTWDADNRIVACGGWLPSNEELGRATWTDRIHWHTQETSFLLMNSSVDAKHGLRDDDYLPVHLAPGTYAVDYCDIEGDSVGCFHRFVS